MARAELAWGTNELISLPVKSAAAAAAAAAAANGVNKPTSQAAADKAKLLAMPNGTGTRGTSATSSTSTTSSTSSAAAHISPRGAGTLKKPGAESSATGGGGGKKPTSRLDKDDDDDVEMSGEQITV
jgi:hypothetical protein